MVALPSTSGNGTLQKFIRLRVFSASSSADGMSVPLSRPGIVPLANGVDKLRLRVQAVNASTYAFSYSDLTSGGKSASWKIVGYGAASEVSGGFTGVSFYSYERSDAMLILIVYRPLWVCLPPETGITRAPLHTSATSLMTLCRACSKSYTTIHDVTSFW